MQNIIISTIIFLSVIIQGSFLPFFFTAGAVPDIALIIIIIWIVRADFNSVLKWAVLGGLLMDIMSFQLIGLNIISFVVVSFVINSLSKRFLVSQLAWKFCVIMLMIVVGTWINYVIIFSWVKIFISADILSENNGASFSQMLLLKSLSNIIIFAIIYWPLEKLDKAFAYQNNRVIIKR